MENDIKNFIKFAKKILLILPDPELISNLDSTDQQFFRDLANTHSGLAAFLSQNILCFFYDECPDIFIDVPFQKSPVFIEEQTEIIDNPVILSVYPNPADDGVIFQIDESLVGTSEVVVFDLTGKLIYQTNTTEQTLVYDTRTLDSGIYIVALKSNGEIVDSKKLVIQH